MNIKTLSGMIFLIGAVVGSAATWQYFKKRYEIIAQNEIDSVKNVFQKEPSKDVLAHDDEKNVNYKKKTSIEACEAIIKNENYTNYTNATSKKEEKGEKDVEPDIFVISPEEFGEYENYDEIDLTYYKDQILTDDSNEIIEDPEDLIGDEALNRFGEFEDDLVFVRNDRLKAYYEICKDSSTYSNLL